MCVHSRGDGVEAAVIVEALGAVGLVVNVMGHLLQVLEVRPGPKKRKEGKISKC